MIKEIEMTPVISSLVLADSLTLLKTWYDNGIREFIDLGYGDPPFNSNKNYNILFNPETDTSEEAFQDIWINVKYYDLIDSFKKYDGGFYEFLINYLKILPNDSYKSYLVFMGILYWFKHKMLKPTGSLYHHCDPTTVHYIKPILDKIFGLNNFRNEIIWKSDGSNWGKSRDASIKYHYNHQNILYYTKSNNYTFNKLFYSLSEEEVMKRFPLNDNDGNGPYAWSMLYKYDENKLQEMIDKGLWKWPRGNKFPRYKQYLKENKGNPVQDLWIDIKSIIKIMKESNDYPTQKPEKLLERIILTSSNPGELVVDLFNGGGTTAIVAAKTGRSFISSDINYRAIQMTVERFYEIKFFPKVNYYVDGIPKSSKELRLLVNSGIYGTSKNSKFALQDITTKFYLKDVISSSKKSGDHSIDGEFYFKYKNKDMKGIIQVTSTASINHLKAFGSEISKGTGDIGVYITFDDTVTMGMRKEVKGYGKIDHIDKFQILTFEDLIDKGKQFEIPKDVMTF
jgi:site-specific DNA-methyltransferase (adenine-specific)